VGDLIGSAYGNRVSGEKIRHFNDLVSNLADPLRPGLAKQQARTLMQALMAEDAAWKNSILIGGSRPMQMPPRE
jgi:3-oxoacyl-(acyl-carrier-protein) synthase